MDWLRRFWVEWFGWHAGREAGNPYREFISSPKEFQAYVEERERFHEPCFLSVSLYCKRDQVYGLDRFFFDFDDKNRACLKCNVEYWNVKTCPACQLETVPESRLDVVWLEVSDFVEKLRTYYGIIPPIVFSGLKGYHVYVFLWKTIEFKPDQEWLLKPIYKLLQKKLLKGLTYPTLDREVIGDVKRLARVPYTHHYSGELCHPVNESREKIRVSPEDLERYRSYGIHEDFFRRVVDEAKLQKKLEAVSRSRPISHIGSSKIRPCLLEALKQQDLNHKVRVAIVAEAAKAGLSESEIEELFRSQADYNHDETSYQVRHIIEGGYKPFKKNTLKELNVCQGRSCRLCLKTGRAVA